MRSRVLLRRLLVIFSLAVADAKDPELPLCPTNMQYFPQNLPMHCRLPGTMPPFQSPVYQNPSLEKQSLPMQVPLSGMTGPITGPIPGPMPMPIMQMSPGQAPAHKLPVIVMPFYSPDTSAKSHTSHQGRPRKHRVTSWHRRPKHFDTDEDSKDIDSSDTDDSNDTSSEHGYWRGPKAGRRSNAHKKPHRKKQQQYKEVLTPILQYVTKDGYVIYEKQISKGEAKDWLVSKTENKNAIELSAPKIEGDNEYEPREPRADKVSMKLLTKDVEELAARTELNPHQLHKKKNYKRKPIKKKDEQ